MSIQELQKKIIAKIKNTKQESILEEVERLLDFEENSGHITNSTKNNSTLLINL